jgi:wyosine [tRNA(Phe)-imidazoG37] synthetase (radical SAM superfamily)
MSRSEKESTANIASAWRRHERQWRDAQYVYAVVSRRSRGVSIGINLNPDKACNFDCIYCQVRREMPVSVRTVNLEKLEKELDRILQADKDGSLYETAPFNLVPKAERGVRDIAFSGNGEPTKCPSFAEAVGIAARARQRFEFNSAKLVLLTNAAYLDRPEIKAALAVMDQNNGEVWAKLDAGTEQYFRIVNRARVPFDRILQNILSAARVRPLVIQSLWLRLDGAAPSTDEIESYCCCLNNLISANGQLKTIQLYTVARDPAEAYVEPLSDEELNRIASIVKGRVPVPVEVFYSAQQSNDA